MWKDIPGYEDAFEVSDDGRVRNKSRKRRPANRWRVYRYERTATLHKSGYLGLKLNEKYHLIHRLVAMAFLEDMSPDARVQHKNGDRLDNRVENLLVVPAPKKEKKVRPSAVVRFWERVVRPGQDECWLWNGALNNAGYGSFGLDGKSMMAHRYSWMLHHGEIPAGMVVMHKCDTRACVNPDHLETGTQEDNIQDAIKKGRFWGRKKMK